MWCLLETQWIRNQYTGTIEGWGGYNAGAFQMLITGFESTGGEFLADAERLKVLEVTQLEIEAAKAKANKRPGMTPDSDHVLGDLDDFDDAAADVGEDFEE